ncbi:MAG: hypothetical protein MJZ21_02940 [archaeon]|nr:hypothetical protein [archaeon]
MTTIARKTAVLAFLAVLVAASAVIVAGEESDAAVKTNLTRVSAEFYTDLDTEYGGLVYLNDLLPTELNPSEWAQDDNGLWYNVNERSSEYGTVLTYGTISNVDAALVRSDILAHYPEFSSDFRILQVKYTVQKDCKFTVTVAKDGMDTVTFPYVEDYKYAGYTFTNNYQSAVLLTIDPTVGDIKPSDARGTYQISVDSNGTSCYSQSQELVGTPLLLSGKVVDKDDRAIPGAVVYYQDGYSSSPSVSTDEAGNYQIKVAYGSTVFVTSIAAENYTFDPEINHMTGEGFAYGTVTTDVAPGPTFIANEHTMTVYVKDMSGRAVVGQEILLKWFLQNGSGPYIIDEVPVVGTFITDLEGKCKVSFADAPGIASVTYLYAVLTNARPGFYTWDFDEGIIGTGSETPDPLKPVLEKAGNAYLDIVGYTDGLLKVRQYSAEITVTGAGASAALSDIVPDVGWFAEVASTDNYNVVNIPSSAWEVDSDANLWADASDASGVSVVHFCKPLAPPTGTRYYLLGAGVAPVDTSIASKFTFYVGPVTGPGMADLESRIAPYKGMTAIPYSLSGTFGIEADQEAYVFTYSLSGVIPDYIDVLCEYDIGKMTFIQPKIGAALSFDITVQKGMYLKFNINSAGYVIEKSEFTTPVILNDLSVISDCKSAAATVDRGTPLVMTEKVTVTGLSDGELVTISFTNSGIAVTVTVAAGSGPFDFHPMGWADSMVSDMSATLPYGNFIEETSAGVYVTAPMKDIAFVTYNSDVLPADVSVISPNILVVAYYDGKEVGSKKSNIDGIGIITVPDLPGIVYRYESYTLAPVVVSDGPFEGYTSFNMKGIIDVDRDVYITLNIKYVATSVGTDGIPVYSDLKPAEAVSLKVGDSVDFIAVEEKHFFFGGWTLGGEKISNMTNPNLCTIPVTTSLDGMTLVANYSAYDEPVKENPLDMTAVSLGMIGIILSILAFAYVITQVRR